MTLRSLLARNRTACAEGSDHPSGPAQVCGPPVEVGTDSLPTSRQQEVLPDNQGRLADRRTPRREDVKKRGCGSPSIKRYFVAEGSLEHRSTDSTVESLGPSKRQKTADPGSDGGSEGECELCVRCQHWVPLDVCQEHSDFHLAQDLQQELEVSTENLHSACSPALVCLPA